MFNMNKSVLLNKIISLILAFVFLLPIFYALSTSFKTYGEVYTYPITVLPRVFSVEGYSYVFQNLNFLKIIYNTLYVSTFATIITVMITMMAGYAIAKGLFKYRKLIGNLMIMTTFIPIGITLVGVFIIVKNMNLLNNLWGLILPMVFSPTGTFIAVQYMHSIPDEIIESAKIDGANEWQIFSKIIFPLSYPLLATLTIFSFTWRWGDFVLPLVTINQGNLYTVQLGLSYVEGNFLLSWNTIMAYALLSLALPLILFFLFQKLFMAGITAGSVKG